MSGHRYSGSRADGSGDVVRTQPYHRFIFEGDMITGEDFSPPGAVFFRITLDSTADSGLRRSRRPGSKYSFLVFGA